MIPTIDELYSNSFSNDKSQSTKKSQIFKAIKAFSIYSKSSIKGLGAGASAWECKSKIRMQVTFIKFSFPFATLVSNFTFLILTAK